MKKWICMLLALLMALSCAANAEADMAVESNFSGGAAVMDESGALWFSMNGLKRLNADNSVDAIVDGEVRDLQRVGGEIYYVLRVNLDEESMDPAYEDTLWRIGASGAPEQIGEARAYGQLREYGDDYSYLSNGTTFAGYGDLCVYGDYIYFIGTDDQPGEYAIDVAYWGDEENLRVETAYSGACAVYRMKKDGGELTRLIPDLGNGEAHLAIANGRIAVASCYLNSVFAYDFSNFMLYDMDGALIKAMKNNSPERHSSFFKEEEEFTCIVSSIQTDGEKIYASFCDSEGDFASSRLVDVENADESIVIEAFYARSLIADGTIYYVTADVQDTFYTDNMAYTTVLRSRAADGVDRLLAHVPHDYIGYDMKLALLGDQLYLCSSQQYADIESGKGTLLRVDLASGSVDELNDAGFVVSMACDPEFYTAPVLAWNSETDNEDESGEDYVEGAFLLPDSDVYLYSDEELEMYDAETLALMRNEILARHGYVFKKEVYQQYFSAQSWYSPNPDFDYSDLNAVEMENVETIKALEEK